MWPPRAVRRGWNSTSSAALARTRAEAGLGAAATTWPSPIVFTMITVQRALWLMRFGTLPSRNSLRPAMPALPTTSTSMACSCEASTIAIAGSSWITTCPRARSPAIERA